MPLPATIDIAKENLFASVDEMRERNIPEVIQQRLLRLRDMYNYWLQYPRIREQEIVLELQKRYQIQKSAAYEDIRIIKYLLGDLNKATKDYHRYRFIQRNEESYEMAKRMKDARAMAACDNYYAKYMQLDKEDAKDLGYDKIVVQPFQPDSDPTIIGIKPIPNIRQRIADKIKQYMNEDVQDIQFEDADFNEDDIFNPKKITGGTRTMREYFHDTQQQVLFTPAKDIVLCAGRGWGKGPIHAAINLRNMQRMPGSITGFVAANCKRALTNTIPSMLIHWQRWGFKRDVHWTIGKKPPKSWGWGEPIFQPDNWENVISFYNGSIGYIISQDRSGTSNSFSLDYLDIDEAKYIDFEQLKDETLPANRGNKQYFGHHYFHHGMLITSDMPVTKKGSWFLDYEKKCDPELIEVIQATVHEIWRTKKRIRDIQAKSEPVPLYLKDYLRTLNRDVCRMGSVAVLYREFSTIENMQLLGEAFINQMKRDLPPLTFQTAILCKRIGISRDGFYSSMTEGHKYNATDFSYLDSLEYQFDKIKEPSCLMDADLDRDKPICIAFDFNANINWLVAGQPDRNRLKVIKSFWVKYERKLEALVDDFCKYYRHQRRKEVIFYYDSTALGSNYAVNDEDFHYVIERAFQDRGWEVRSVYIGPPMKHIEKWLLLNRMFAGKAKLIPFFNEQNNEDLLISVQTAGVYNGGKDKRGEKLAETEEDQLQARTDGSDAFDTLCIGCERFPQMTFDMFVTSSM